MVHGTTSTTTPQYDYMYHTQHNSIAQLIRPPPAEELYKLNVYYKNQCYNIAQYTIYKGESIRDAKEDVHFIKRCNTYTIVDIH